MIEKYSPIQPSPLDNLLKQFGLEKTAESLTRTNRDGSKGVKLRKSYKNHISDLPGKHNIPGPKPIPNGMLDPMISQAPHVIKPLDGQMLLKALMFEKLPHGGIPGIDKSEIAIGGPGDGSFRRDDIDNDDDDGRKNKRKKKAQLNGDLKRQHI